MRIHSRDWQVEDTIFFEQEGRFPRCAGCGIFAKMTGKSPSDEDVQRCHREAEEANGSKGTQANEKGFSFQSLRQADRNC
jgi:hypothetical protein